MSFQGISDMTRNIRLSKSVIGEEEKRAVLGVLDREMLGMGSEVEEFEIALQGFFHRSVACVTNGTVALQLALEGCGVGPGDEVVVPSLTYIACFQAITAAGAIPVCCDIDESTLTMSPKDLSKRITKRTKAIMPVHYAGDPGNLQQILDIAAEKKIRIVEDAAHAFGSKCQGRLVGSFGDIACFSFDGIKNITSGEGGCVVSNDLDLIERVKTSRLLGIPNDSLKRAKGERTWLFCNVTRGCRGHMSNIMAAIGIEQLRKFEKFAKIRKELASYYDEVLSNNAYVRILRRNYADIVPHIYVVRITNPENRETLRQQLRMSGIQTGVHYQPNHLIRSICPPPVYPLPITESVFPSLLTLPLHPDLTKSDIEWVGAMLLKNSAEMVGQS